MKLTMNEMVALALNPLEICYVLLRDVMAVKNGDEASKCGVLKCVLLG